MKQRAFCTLLMVISLVMFSLFVGYDAEAKDKIRIGASRSLSGPMAAVGDSAFGPILRMWVEDTNARGGIFVKEYGKRLPIEMIIYDDKSEVGTMTRLLEKLIVEDKVDFVFPPVGTAMLFAAAPIANKHGYILLGAEGGAVRIREMIAGLPYFFGSLNFADHNQVPVMADVFAELGVKTAAVMFIADLHGAEYSGVAVPQLTMKGVDVKLLRSVPPGIKDLSPVIRAAKAADVDAFLSFCMPAENILVTRQSIELGFNPKIFMTGPGANFGFYRQIFGAASEGVMGWGAWNAKTSPGAKEFSEKFIARFGHERTDWWGHLFYLGALEFWTKAVEKAGTLDQKKIRDIMATEKFDTVLGPTFFRNQLMAVEAHPGQMGQWQKGVYEVIGPKEKRTAPPIYPKPAWPK